MRDPKLRAVAYLREGAVAQPAFIEPTAAQTQTHTKVMGEWWVVVVVVGES